MPKGSLEASEIGTAAGPLRENLRQLEVKVASLKRQRVDVEALLRERDALEDQLLLAEGLGLDVRAERARSLTLDGALRARARRLVRWTGGRGGFAAARARNNPQEGRWWWNLDVELRQQAARSLRRAAVVVVSVVAVLLLVNAVLTRFFGPTPEQSAFSELTEQAQVHLSNGMLVEATRSYERALAMVPSDVEARCDLGVLYELQGRAADARAAFAAAEQYSSSRDMFLFDQARAYLMLGQTDRALDLATAAATEFDQSPYVFFVLGEALQAKGQTMAAAQSFDVAAQLAGEQGIDVLVALSRERQAMLIGGAR